MQRARANMHLLMMIIVMMWGFMAMAAAQSHCDPLTQYKKNDQCCKMCGPALHPHHFKGMVQHLWEIRLFAFSPRLRGDRYLSRICQFNMKLHPGTRMPTHSDCLDPQCTECGVNEYQETYTSKPKCQRQPYCDPNKNFEVPVHKSKKKQSTCMCKEGFHCSSGECITCVSHRTCKPGQEARPKGNHTHDTVCQPCPKGTFSSDNSWDGVCKKWTECENGFHIQQSGTSVSDSICEETSRTHTIVIIVVCSVVGVLAVGALVFFLCKGKPGDAKGKVKDCVEKCMGVKWEPIGEPSVLVTTPTEATEDESLIQELPSSQEEASARTPEEHEDPQSPAASADVVFTENGNFVTQENGKSVILSRQESQPRTFTD